MEHDESRFVLERKARLQLQQLIADGNTPQKIVKRARIILMTADGHGVMAIMREVGVSKTTVWRWQEYFAEAGVEGLVKGRSKPPGRKPISAAIKLKVVEKTVKERPVNATHWSVRTMAKPNTLSSRISSKVSGSLPIQTSPLRSGTSSAFTSTRRRGRLCWPSTRKAKFKHSTGPSRACL